MKNYRILTIAVVVMLLSSCVTTKKFNSLKSEYNKMQTDYNTCETSNKNCQDNLQTAQDELAKEKSDMQAQIDYLKKNNTQVLSALEDMSVVTNKQAENIKQSLTQIQGLQSAIARKDSLNMALVENIKGAIGNLSDTDINVKVEKGVVYIDISDKMLFNTARYNVTPQASVVLGKVSKVLNVYPNLDVMVVGNTDSIPIHTDCMDDNWDLSVKRATSVVRILEKQYGINPERMTAAGQGKYNPVASNKIAEGRAQNRRTTIIILPELDQFFKLLLKK
jgi:chemotaxis protein MotB